MKNVYSCSMPNSGSLARYFSAIGRSWARGVGGVRRHVGEEHLAHHQHVVAAADRVGTREHRLQDAVGVAARRLVGARAVEAPDRQARRRRPGSWSSTGAGQWARCRRSRCTPPCTPLKLLSRDRRGPDATGSAGSSGAREPAWEQAVSRPLPQCERRVNEPCPGGAPRRVPELPAGSRTPIIGRADAAAARLRPPHRRGARGALRPPLVHRRARHASRASPSPPPSSRPRSRKA